MKNAVRLMGVGLLVAGQLVACGGEVEAVEEAQPRSKPVMSKLRRPAAGAVQKAPEASEEGNVHQLGPAPNLSSIQVLAVCSDDFYNTYYPYECEDVTATTLTGFNHGGAIIVITKEMGYRQTGTQSITLGAYNMSEYYNDPILNSYNEMIGWYRYFEAVNGQQSGVFTYSANSINTYTQYSDFVQVQ